MSERPTMLVTGGAKRIGAAIARAYGAAGWHVVIHYGRSQAQAEDLAAELPSAEIVSCELDDWDAPLAMVAQLAERLGGLARAGELRRDVRPRHRAKTRCRDVRKGDAGECRHPGTAGAGLPRPVTQPAWPPGDPRHRPEAAQSQSGLLLLHDEQARPCCD
ncbi:conserved hypothetical protein, partial [Ricinus communis]